VLLGFGKRVIFFAQISGKWHANHTERHLENWSGVFSFPHKLWISVTYELL
jgi:hypothetical protein